VQAFLDELYRINRVERHVFIEESDMFAPQKPIGPEENLCLSSVDGFVRRGGNHNLGCTLITQRSAVLNKNILTQSDCLVILRTLAPQDKKAIQAWVEQQTDEDEEKLKQWYDSLNNLENGEAWVWHPEKPVIYEKVQFRKRETFHATREFIRSPQATQVKLMNVSEFVSKFKAIFEQKSALMHTISAQETLSVTDKAELEKLQAEVGALRTEVEEFRSGRKLAESVQGRLKFLGGVKLDLEKRLEAQGEELKLYDELKSVLRRMFPKGIPENAFLQQPGDKTVSLQATTTIVDVAPAEKLVTVNDENMRGKILAVAKKGKLDMWRRLDEIVKAIQEEHWNASAAEVNNALNDLEKQGLIAKKHTDRNYYCLANGVKFKEAT
jgi:cell division protein FtsB